MRLLLLLLNLLTLFCCLGRAQTKDSLLEAYEARQMGYIDTLPTSFYVTCGGILASNVNGNFAHFIFDQTTSYPPGNSTVSFIYAGSLGTAQFGAGAEFASHRRFWMRHRFEGQYFHLKGTFGYDYNEGRTSTFLSLHDHAEGEFTMDALALSYKFEPSTRRFFGSLGLTALIASVVVEEHTARSTTDPYGRTSQSASNKRTWCHPVNYPLSIGGGMIFRTPKLIVKPGLYAMPCLRNNFYYYMVSVSIGWRTYQLTSY